MKLTRKVYANRNEKTLDFVIGFVGWFLLNGALWGLQVAIPLAAGSIPGAFDSGLLGRIVIVGTGGLGLGCLLANFTLVAFFAAYRSWVALGALAAFGVSLLTVLCLGLLVYASCYCLSAGCGF